MTPSYDQNAIGAAKAPGKIDFELPLGRDNLGELGFYEGLSWRNAGVIDGVERHGGDAPDCGYITGITSGEQVAFNEKGRTLEFSADDTFDVVKVNVTAAWSQELTVKIIGYVDGVEKFRTLAKVTDDAPTLVKLGWVGVDDVLMKSVRPVSDPDQPFHGSQFAMDDLVIDNLTSAPPPAHAFAGDAAAHDMLAVSAGPHALAAITVLV